MIGIELMTRIAAPVERCFDLSRSVDLHMASTNWTGERAIAGVVSGLIGAGQQVSWCGRHFGVWVTQTGRITAFERPRYFQDSMVQGRFRSFCHDHYFEVQGNETVMRDLMQLEAPFGPAGLVAERVLLRRHMRDLLERRKECIRHAAESEEWRKDLN
jgi:ligand-binding SRPBCC domain-containing protein